MLILDTAGDTIRAEASAASSITVSCYGIETASGADTFKRLGVAQLTGSGTQDIIYTVPASTSTVCMMIVIANTSASARTIKLWDVENGGSPGDANAILGTIAIPANSSILWNKGNIKEIPTIAGTDEKVGIDSSAVAGYIGAASGDGVLRTGAGLSYVDGGDFITLTVDIGIADGKILKVDHVSPADNDYAKFTASGLEGRSYAETKTDLGLATGDSPQFTGLEIGHASDTTLSKASAGNLNVEGKLIYRADGTDVPIGDGGTGQSTAQAAIDALSAVSAATNEHVLTKDTATGNAKFKAAAGGAAFSAFATDDTDSQTLVPDHSYLAGTDGFVIVVVTMNANDFTRIYVDSIAQTPSTIIGQITHANADDGLYSTLTVPVQSGKYFEIASDAVTTTITWMSVGTLVKPADQD